MNLIKNLTFQEAATFIAGLVAVAVGLTIYLVSHQLTAFNAGLMGTGIGIMGGQTVNTATKP